MNRQAQPSGIAIGDTIALKIQKLRSEQKLTGSQPLLRIDNREEEFKAPYQFDTSQGVIHRTGCRSIPENSKSALYGVWEFKTRDQNLACPKCKPVPDERNREDSNFGLDLLFGVLSVVDQFSGVIRERGREFRRSAEGRRLSADLDGLYRELGERERQAVDTVLTSLDGLARVVQDFDAELKESDEQSDRGPDE